MRSATELVSNNRLVVRGFLNSIHLVLADTTVNIPLTIFADYESANAREHGGVRRSAAECGGYARRLATPRAVPVCAPPPRLLLVVFFKRPGAPGQLRRA